MKTYIAFKNEVDGLSSVFDTVNAEEKIAASAVQSLKKDIINLNVYGDEIEKMMQSLSLFYQNNSHPLMRKDKRGKRALLILTGDKGLVGGLWHQIINKSLKNIDSYQSIILYGIRGKKFLDEENVEIHKFFTSDPDVSHAEDSDAISDYFFDQFRSGAFSHVDILYPQFISIAKQKSELIQFLPFEFKLKYDGGGNNNAPGYPIFEPSKSKIFEKLLDKYIKVFFYKIFSETKLCKFSARTVSMEHARVKTQELIKKDVHDYNKQRHRMLTQRQLVSFGAHKSSN